MVNHEAWIDPPAQPVVPVFDPQRKNEPTEYYFMPYPKKMRDHWMEVAGNVCQTLVYDEVHGWRICGRPAQEVDHIIPESQQLFDGNDPNNSVGVPRCITHHRGEGRDEDGDIAGYGDWNWSKHPDVHEALEKYRAGDIYSFQNMGKAHKEAAQRGERFWNTDWSVDEFEKEHMEDLERQAGKHRPKVKPHKEKRQ